MVSIVVPTYNEVQNITVLLNQLTHILRRERYEIIVVDDNSPDGTGNAVMKKSKTSNNIRLLTRHNDRGLSSAIVSGFEHAKGDVFLVLDADLSHDPRIIPRMIREIDNGADMVVGSRRVAGGGVDNWPRYRKLTSDIATLLARLFLHIPIRDPMSGYFCLRRELYTSIKDRLDAKGYKILLEIYAYARPHQVVEVPYIFKNRTQGYSKLSETVISQYISMLRKLRY